MPHDLRTHGDGACPSWEESNRRNRKLREVAKAKKAWDSRNCKPQDKCTPKNCSTKTDCTWDAFNSERKRL